MSRYQQKCAKTKCDNCLAAVRRLEALGHDTQQDEQQPKRIVNWSHADWDKYYADHVCQEEKDVVAAPEYELVKCIRGAHAEPVPEGMTREWSPRVKRVSCSLPPRDWLIHQDRILVFIHSNNREEDDEDDDDHMQCEPQVRFVDPLARQFEAGLLTLIRDHGCIIDCQVADHKKCTFNMLIYAPVPADKQAAKLHVDLLNKIIYDAQIKQRVHMMKTAQLRVTPLVPVVASQL